MLHDFARLIGQPHVQPFEAVGEAEMIEAEQVHDRRVQIVDVHRIDDRRPADFVGGADHLATANAAAGHQEAERKR